VITQWDWADQKTYLHDEIASDKRNPTVNANGLIYGATEESTPNFPWLDPKNHKVTIDYRPVHTYTLTNEVAYIEPKARVY
jgi:hypothetical protein